MAGSKSNYLSVKLSQLPLGGVAFTPGATLYAALWTATLDDTSTGATTGEAAYTSYARVAVTNDQVSGWNAATGTTTATVTNKNAITFPTSTGGTATVTYFAIVDSASGAGNIYYWCTVSSTTINNGDTPKVNASSFTVVED